jgi:putative FmdB family regulatory protein
VPIYEYRCPDGHEFEVVQRMTEDPVATCEVCGESVQRVFRPVAVHFKGSGFYTTDYARKGSSEAKSGAKSDTDSKGDSGKSEAKGSGEKTKTGTSKD